MTDLPPPPAPKKIKSMPPGAPPPPGSLPPGSAPPSMMGMPMMAGPMGGTPTIGGMGPNLCFNFYSPYGTPCFPCPPPAAGCGGGGDEPAKEEKPKPPTYVQGPRTWRLPRMPTQQGKPLKSEPCTIM